MSSPAITPEELKRRQRLAALKLIFPDEKGALLHAPILFALGVCEQLPVLSGALKAQLEEGVALKPGDDTEPWEDKTRLEVAAVLDWATRLELGLHDLRKALFFRFNNRVVAKEDRALREEALKSVVEPSLPEDDRPAALKPPEPEPVPPQAPREKKPEERAKESVALLFDNMFGSDRAAAKS